MEKWLNNMRSEITEKTPKQMLTGKRQRNIIEELIQFTQQPVEKARSELIYKIVERIKSKVLGREEKTNSYKTRHTITV